MSNLDHVFKGTLDRQRIAFKYYGYLPPPKGVTEDVDLPIADFRPGTRYIVFWSESGRITKLRGGLANQLIYAIQSGITRFPERYFDWTEELIGKKQCVKYNLSSIRAIRRFVMEQLGGFHSVSWMRPL